MWLAVDEIKTINTSVVEKFEVYKERDGTYSLGAFPISGDLQTVIRNGTFDEMVSLHAKLKKKLCDALVRHEPLIEL